MALLRDPARDMAQRMAENGAQMVLSEPALLTQRLRQDVPR